MPRSDHDPDTNERSQLLGGANTKLNNDDISGKPLKGKYSDEPEEDYFGLPSSDAVDVEDSDSVESKSSLYLILLTTCIGGLQIVWSVELSNGSPYLLSLGMSKALLAFVWLAGPLTGVLVQPYVGIKSDNCRISWGKRKPFMVAGTIGTVVSSMILAYARDIVRVCGRFGDAPYVGGYKVWTIILATVMMWCLDFSINTVQAAVRAFIVDNAPSHQQESANAWASRLNGAGNVLGYLFGYLNLPRYFHFLGNTQFKVLVVLASIALSSGVLISVLSVKERNPQLEPPLNDNQEGGILAFFRQVFSSMQRLPPPIRKVCEIQFFHWIGWFPFLFYITTWIGQLYVNPYLKPGMSYDEVEQLWAKATRVGTLALLVYAVVSLASNIILPFLIVPSYKPVESDDDDDESIPPAPITPITPMTPIAVRTPGVRTPGTAWAGRPPMSRAGTSQWKPGHRPRTLSRSQTSLSLNRPLNTPGLARLSTTPGLSRLSRAERSQTPETTSKWLTALQIPGLTLRRAWLLAQLLFAGCMWSTLFISTPLGGSIMVALMGISWSLSLWAPFALISGEIAKREEARRKKRRDKIANGQDADGLDDKETEEEDQAGIILGLHNVALSAPQVLATLISSAIFKLLQKPRNVPGDTSVGWTLRIGGLAALVAAFITYRMKEPADDIEEDNVSP